MNIIGVVSVAEIHVLVNCCIKEKSKRENVEKHVATENRKAQEFPLP